MGYTYTQRYNPLLFASNDKLWTLLRGNIYEKVFDISNLDRYGNGADLSKMNCTVSINVVKKILVVIQLQSRLWSYTNIWDLVYKNISK